MGCLPDSSISVPEAAPKLSHSYSQGQDGSDGAQAMETSKDFLQIPAHRTTADSVLNWEVYEGEYAPLALVGGLFTPDEDTSCNSDDTTYTIDGGLRGLNEERIPSLVDAFLQNAHTKNPILDVEMLVKKARVLACQGVGWDASSCIVLLACAIGAIARPFDAAIPTSPSHLAESQASEVFHTSVAMSAKELQQGESYFVLACRRLGGLKHSILASQCYFFAGGE